LKLVPLGGFRLCFALCFPNFGRWVCLFCENPLSLPSCIHLSTIGTKFLAPPYHLFAVRFLVLFPPHPFKPMLTRGTAYLPFSMRPGFKVSPLLRDPKCDTTLLSPSLLRNFFLCVVPRGCPVHFWRFYPFRKTSLSRFCAFFSLPSFFFLFDFVSWSRLKLRGFFSSPKLLTQLSQCRIFFASCPTIF